MMLPIIVALTGLASVPSDSLHEAAVAARVEIVRTEFGVSHILAQDLEAMGFGLGYVQSEDYGEEVAFTLIKSRGEYARYVGKDSIEGDFTGKERHALAAATFHLLESDTRAVYRGFAAGVNHYVRLHRAEFPDWVEPSFTAVDAHAGDVQVWSRSNAILRALRDQPGEGDAPAGGSRRDPVDGPDDGSNAWAFAPERTASGHAILLRNPHLRWDAGYYEAHVRVPGVVDFYGDFRIGGAFGIIGGFNRHLGWATTNNYPTYSQVYALAADPAREDHYLLDGRAHPMEARAVAVDFREEDGTEGTEVRTTWWTSVGPVIHRTAERVYVVKDPRAGEYRRGEQFLRMMRTTTLAEWLEVMRMRAHPSSNFTYADAAGNIAHLYNARIPLLPHEPTGDTAAFAARSQDVWSELVPVESLPLYINPPGGYVQQANDTPDYTNLNVHLDRDTVARNLPEPRLRLRSQLSLDLVDGEEVFSLEDVVALKHSPRMLLAERVTDDLLAALESSGTNGAVSRGVRVLRGWDRSARAESRGGVLFEAWWDAYREMADTALLFREAWSAERPVDTPHGVGQPQVAVAAFQAAVDSLRGRGIPLDARWGDVHRVRRGEVDVPVSGCGAALGCFRTLSFARDEDGKLSATSGDGWVLAVEFGPQPRAYSVLAYGQSRREGSPHHDDQAALFAQGRMKDVSFRDEDIRRATLRRYRPGEEGRP